MPTARYESVPVDVAPLAQPLKFEFSGRVAKNRFFKAAMVEALATWSPKNLEERGIPTKETVELYRRWGENEWGVITTGNVHIEFDMLSMVGDLIITPECPPSGPRFEAFKQMAAAGKAHGSLMIAQVSHPGRQLQANIRKDAISASAIPIPSSSYATPREATKADIARIVEGFAHAAAYLQQAGFDGVELHGAHGYLIAQFLSERTNRRTDEYGGSVENRLRIVTEIAEAARARLAANPRPDAGFVLGIKLNSVEFQDAGLAQRDAGAICAGLERAGFDFVELSGGSHEDIGFGGEQRESTRRREAYFLEFVRDVAPRLSRTRTYLVGGLRTAGAMVDALGVVDGVSLGRPAAQEPDLPRRILAREVEGAARPTRDFVVDAMLGVQGAGAQMRQLGKGLPRPADLGSEAEAARAKADIEAHAARVAADAETLELHGFADLTVSEVAAA